jgi:Fe-Mn family superoxide dismutase
MPFTLPELPYAYDALEPYIDEETMHIHHDKHHAAYVTNLNAALEGTALADEPIERVLLSLGTLPQDKQGAVRNNGGGHVNHSLFWLWMTPGGATTPTGELASAISTSFGTLESLQEQFTKAAMTRFGSGWAWVVKDDSGALSIVSTPNQDNPIMDDKTPILGVDVWEHAYYLKYRNVRADYLKAWWNVVNWDEVGKSFSA